MAPPTAGSGDRPNQLPTRENAFFKRIVRCYEHKQYKHGLRFAKQILSNPKFAEHGETLAMKGLILNCMGRREEAAEHIRRGLRNDLKSHVCWHVFGLLQRSEKKYDEAIKAYRNALKWDKDNIQILRDLSLLQIQMRDLEGYKETRYQLFMLRPSQRASWIGYAMAHHLLEEYEMCLRILEEYCKAQTTDSYDFEHSELLLYQNMVLRESGQLDNALKQLCSHERQIYDKVALDVTKAELLIHCNEKDKAAMIFRSLIDRNPENREYYEKLAMCHGHDDDRPISLQWKLELYRDVCQKYPRALTPKRLALGAATGEHFVSLASAYLKNGFEKGIPPLFVTIRELLKDKEKMNCFHAITSGYLKNLKTFVKLDENDEEENPTAILWVYLFLSSHYDYVDDTTRALEAIDEAISHTPTLIELYSAKAKIYKHLGGYFEALKWAEEAQSMDTADRFINFKCAKYMLKVGLVTEAEEMCAPFTREGVPAMENLNEMQCMWFELEVAKAHKRLGQLGDSLKKCHEIDRHFVEIIEDQFDFHTYCVRKMTLCAYVKLLRLEDVLRKSSYYRKAAICAMKIYLSLYDKPLQDAGAHNRGASDEMTASELKKLKNKERKAAKKAALAKEQQKAAQDRIKSRQAQQQVQKEDLEDSPVGLESLDSDKLVKTEVPLEEAAKFFLPIMQLNCGCLKAYSLGFEIYLRKGKVLIMLHCLNKMITLDASSPLTHLSKVKFLRFVSGKMFLEPMGELVKESITDLIGTSDPFQLNSDFRKANQSSLPHLLTANLASYHLDNSSGQGNIAELTSENISGYSGCSWKVCRKILKHVTEEDFGPVDSSRVQSFKKWCHMRFPLCDVFAPPSASPSQFSWQTSVGGETSEE